MSRVIEKCPIKYVIGLQTVVMRGSDSNAFVDISTHCWSLRFVQIAPNDGLSCRLCEHTNSEDGFILRNFFSDLEARIFVFSSRVSRESLKGDFCRE